jgi:hypothetical protein
MGESLERRLARLEAAAAQSETAAPSHVPPLSDDERAARVDALFTNVSNRWRRASDELGRDRGDHPDLADLVCRREPPHLRDRRYGIALDLSAARYCDRETGAFICDGRYPRIVELLRRVERRKAQRRETEEREAVYRHSADQRQAEACMRSVERSAHIIS